MLVMQVGKETNGLAGVVDETADAEGAGRVNRTSYGEKSMMMPRAGLRS
jgi:hypothetical protein